MEEIWDENMDKDIFDKVTRTNVGSAHGRDRIAKPNYGSDKSHMFT